MILIVGKEGGRYAPQIFGFVSTNLLDHPSVMFYKLLGIVTFFASDLRAQLRKMACGAMMYILCQVTNRASQKRHR